MNYTVILFLILVIGTLLFSFFVIRLWKKTRSISFLLGQFYLFYWGIAGSWIFMFDSIYNFKGEIVGLHYYYFYEKMFEVFLDQSYLKATFYHVVFILFTQIFLLLSYKSQDSSSPSKLLEVSSKKIILACISLLAVSIIIIKSEIIYAFTYNKVLYTIVELSSNRFFSIHQIALQLAVLLYIFYISLVVSSPNAKKIKLTQQSKKSFSLTLILSLIFILTLMILGNKKELLFAGVVGILFFIDNNLINRASLRNLTILSIIVIVPLLATDIIRSGKFNSLLHLKYERNISKEIAQNSSAMINENKKYGLTHNLGLVIFSNELFFPHFSMYGAIKNNVPVSTGLSLKNLVASFVPKVILEKRPIDSYSYYIKYTKKDKEGKQGFTIHHATAWLLNFGFGGLILGGICLGSLWGKLSSFSINNTENNLKNVFMHLTPAITCAFLPILIRNGIESYKSFLVEGIIFTCLLIYLTLKDTLFRIK